MSEETVEYIDETPVKDEEESKPVTLLDMLQYELRERMTVALEYKNKIDGAKTSSKKQYFQKKLKKNNVEAAKILTAIERVALQQKIKETEEKNPEMLIDADWLRNKTENEPDDESCEAGGQASEK